MKRTLLVLILQLLCSSLVVSSAPLILAPWGRVTGVDLQSTNGNRYHGYLGIPYALPPVGERRWAGPVVHPGPGVGQVFNASIYGMLCPQPYLAVTSMSEDCLTLNVYVPSSAGPQGQDLRSVMVYIHGGSFTYGGAPQFAPGSLVTRGDVIVVVIQFRLGILGFLSSGDDAVSGNYGLWDQNLALRWVKGNIRAFGGDPDSVTLIGQSSGGACAGYQLLSPYSKDLFNRAVLQSGVPEASWAVDLNPKRGFYSLAKEVGCYCHEDDSASRDQRISLEMWARQMLGLKGTSAAEAVERFRAYERHVQMLQCLRKLDVSRLLPFTVITANRDDFDLFQSFPYVPNIDGDFVPRSPMDLLKDPRYLEENDVISRDVMLGLNNEEGPLIITYIQSLNVAKNVSAYLLTEEYRKLAFQNELQFHHGKQLLQDDSRLSPIFDVLQFFYQDGKRRLSLKSMADLFSDTAFIVPAVTMARQLSRAQRESQQPGSSVYFYLFDHHPVYKSQQQWKGMAHSDDVKYLFDAGPLMSRSGFTQDDYRLADNFVNMLATFAKTGNPSSVVGGNWPEFSSPDEKFLSFGLLPRVDDHPYNKRVALWMDLVPSLLNATQGECTQERVTPQNEMQNSWYGKPQGPKWPQKWTRKGWPFG